MKAYDYVKEFGEGIDRIFREQAATGADGLKFIANDFILRVTLPKVTEKLTEKVTEKLSSNRIQILQLMQDNPYITKAELAQIIGIREISVWRNIEAMRGKYLRRIGPDKGGFWQVLITQ